MIEEAFWGPPTMPRDEFPKPVVRTVGLRAGYLCSNPDCRRPTAGPHSQPDKALITGEAAHICAASIGGPRYNPNQTPEERKSIGNALWLCTICSKRVDTDWQAWPDTKLLQMKAEHEKWIDGQEMIPSLPEFALTTRSGLRATTQLPEITGPMIAELREQELTIRNPNRVQLFNLVLSMILPEAVLCYGQTSHNAGTYVTAKPATQPWIVETVADGSKVTAPRFSPTMHHSLEIPAISANEVIAVAFYTIDPHYQVMFSPARPPGFPSDLDALFPDNHIKFFLEGTIQFILRGEYVTNELFIPLRYSFKNRIVSSLPCQTTREPWDVAPTMHFPAVQMAGEAHVSVKPLSP